MRTDTVRTTRTRAPGRHLRTTRTRAPGPHERHTNAGGSVVAFSPSGGLTTARTAGSRSHAPRRVTVLPPPAAALWARSAVLWRIGAVAQTLRISATALYDAV